MKPLTAFVTDGDQRPALAITRSLGRRGMAVIVGAEQPDSLASASKYCVRRVSYPSPMHQPDAFERWIVEFAERERIDVIMPVTDVTTHLVAKHAQALNRFSATAVPPFDAFEFVTDKTSLALLAVKCGVTVPRTLYVQNRSVIKELLDQIQYPAVIKPSRSRIRTSSGWLPAAVQYAHDEADLLRLYQDVECLACYPSMIQERIVGPGVGVFVLCDHGELRAVFAHRRLREKPPSGGASVLCESVDLDPALLDEAMRLLGPLGWHGVAMMEFKQDARTGRSFLMEVNGRFWGSLQLAIDAGVDFPYLSCQLALGETIAPPLEYRVGAKSRWLLGDLDHLIARLLHTRGELNLPREAPSRARAIVDFLKPMSRGMRYDVVAGDDPRPFLHEARQYVRDCSASAVRKGHQLFVRAPQPAAPVTAVK
jgi:predicted ATP-grasp superfamily ATP-dependent carboligase